MTYPYILANGIIGEIELPVSSNRDCGSYLKLMTSHFPTQSTLKRETMTWPLDRQRFVLIEVYIDEKFLPLLDGEERWLRITRFITDRQAWFFSYGNRRVNP